MLTTALAGAGAGIGTTIGSAQDTAADPTWNCRASVAWVEEPALGILDRTEPFVANGNASTSAPDRPSCVSDVSQLPDVTFTDPAIMIEDAAKAETKVDPSDIAQRNTRTNTATASASKITALDGNLVAEAVQSRASAKCVAGVPVLEGASSIAKVTLAGQLLPLEEILGQLIPALNEIGIPTGFYRIDKDEQTVVDNAQGGKTLTQTALRVTVLPVIGSPLAVVTLGETKASYTAGVCDDPPPPPTVTTTETIKEAVPGPTVTETTTQTVPGPTVTQTQTQTVPGPTRTVQAPPTVLTKTQVLQANGRGASNCARLRMFFPDNRKRALGVRFGKERVVTRGRLVSCAGKSIVAARIDVVHILPNGKRLVKTGLRSRALGRVTLILPKNLFTRKIEYRYRPNLASTRVASRQTLTINVRDKAGRLVKKAPAGQGKPQF